MNIAVAIPWHYTQSQLKYSYCTLHWHLIICILSYRTHSVIKPYCKFILWKMSPCYNCLPVRRKCCHYDDIVLIACTGICHLATFGETAVQWDLISTWMNAFSHLLTNLNTVVWKYIIVNHNGIKLYVCLSRNIWTVLPSFWKYRPWFFNVWILLIYEIKRDQISCHELIYTMNPVVDKISWLNGLLLLSTHHL